MARTAQSIPEASARPRRTPLAKRNRFAIKNQEPGYFYRVVNDTDDRIELLQSQDYEIVTKERVGATGDRRVDNPSPLGSAATISVGLGTRAVVMRQKIENYQEDQQAKQAEIDALESSMYHEAKKKSDYGSLDYER